MMTTERKIQRLCQRTYQTVPPRTLINCSHSQFTYPLPTPLLFNGNLGMAVSNLTRIRDEYHKTLQGQASSFPDRISPLLFNALAGIPGSNCIPAACRPLSPFGPPMKELTPHD